MTTKFAPISYPAAIRSFMGYLEGTEKAQNTIKNYKLDLQAFLNFLKETGRGETGSPSSLELSDIEAFHQHLKKAGLKTNTRRRKLLTVRKFLSYLSKRKRVPVELDRKVPAPEKIERIPVTIDVRSLLSQIQRLPHDTDLDARNRVLLWTLAETGCLVSEVRKLTFQDFTEPGSLEILGKNGRTLTVSAALLAAVGELRSRVEDPNTPIFFGFNRFGPMKGAITSRGVELLVRAYAGKLVDGEVHGLLTPRIFRHSAVMGWWREGIKRDEIQKRLGLKTAYAFRVFEPLFKASASPKSTN